MIVDVSDVHGDSTAVEHGCTVGDSQGQENCLPLC